MKIDFLISKMSNGGAERVVSILANHLDAMGHEVKIITFYGTDDYQLNDTIKRVRLHRQPVIKSVVLNGFFSLFWFYRKKKNRPDIISSHINLLAYMTIPIAIIYRLKIVVSEHINHITNSTFAKRLLRNRFYPLANAVTILTSFDLEYYSRNSKNVLVMPNPCSFHLKKASETDVEKRKEIVAIGDLDRYYHKGFDNLMYISKEVLGKHPDWKFRILGGGGNGMKFLKNLAEELEISDKVIFAGFSKNVQKILLESAIFVLPSRFEGLPMSLLEAMSQGTPSIAYDCVSGPSDIITNEVNGLLIEDQNKEAMINGINMLISDEELRNKFRNVAPKTLEKFEITNVGKKWENLLMTILQNDK